MFDFRPSTLRSSLSEKSITKSTFLTDPYSLPSHISLSQRNVRNRIKSISRMAEEAKPTIAESKFTYFQQSPITMNSFLQKKKLNKVSAQKNNEYLIRRGTQERLIELQRKIVKSCRPEAIDTVLTTQSRCSIINYLEEDIQPKIFDEKTIKSLKRLLIKKHKFQLLRAFYNFRLRTLK